jgi:pimeloyl-ACP methyl ester carboxylesterase
MTDRTDVPVAGGGLATFRLGARRSDAPVVLAIHGITSSSRSWLASGRALDDRAALAAVDLRGRARSSELPGPYGIDAHVRDMIAVLDHYGLHRAVVVGHSLGAYIAVRLASEHPDRIRGLVLVDGGLAIPGSQAVDPERFMETFLGPALARLKMEFPDRAAYHAWWASHPAVTGADVESADLDEYADHDLIGEPPHLRSSVNPDAVRHDALDLLGTDARALTIPATLVCAPRGLLDDPNPMQPLAAAERWAAADPTLRRAMQVPAVNHYTIVLGRHGAATIAAEVARSLEGSSG